MRKSQRQNKIVETTEGIIARLKVAIEDLNIVEVNTKEFDVAVIMFYMLNTGILNEIIVADDTGISIDVVSEVFDNWHGCGILTSEGLDIRLPENPIEQIIELTLNILAGEGKVKRITI